MRGQAQFTLYQYELSKEEVYGLKMLLFPLRSHFLAPDDLQKRVLLLFQITFEDCVLQTTAL
jgi:hypothetical protein